MKAREMKRPLPWSIIIVSIILSKSFATETIPIGKIVADPQSYQLHVVTLTGTVRNFRMLEEPYYGGEGITCYGAYAFTLEDKTGPLEIIVPGGCGVCVLCGKEKAPAKLSEGEKVRVEVTIQAPGHYAGSGHPINGEDTTVTKGIANKISRHEN